MLDAHHAQIVRRRIRQDVLTILAGVALWYAMIKIVPWLTEPRDAGAEEVRP